MKIIDLHCDVLHKMQTAYRKNKQHLSFRDTTTLEVNLTRLKRGNVFIQFFAIFISPQVPSDKAWEYAFEQIKIFQHHVLKPHPEIRQIFHWQQIEELQAREIGAVLTLEGAEAIGNDLNKLKYLYEQGVKLLGLTWNHANLCADGISEPRGAGLTQFGKEVVRLNNEYAVFTDVAHLAEQGFWDVMELADYPIASHANCRRICDHPRNLTDEQIRALFDQDGMMHLTFYPPFLTEATKQRATITDVLRHIEHLCSLGGVKNIGFGSDFDGIDQHVYHLEHAGFYQNLIDELLKYYRENEVRGFAYENFLHHLPNRKGREM